MLGVVVFDALRVVTAVIWWVVAALYAVPSLYAWGMRSAERSWRRRYDEAEVARRRAERDRWRWRLAALWVCLATIWTVLVFV